MICSVQIMNCMRRTGRTLRAARKLMKLFFCKAGDMYECMYINNVGKLRGRKRAVGAKLFMWHGVEIAV